MTTPFHSLLVDYDWDQEQDVFEFLESINRSMLAHIVAKSVFKDFLLSCNEDDQRRMLTIISKRNSAALVKYCKITGLTVELKPEHSRSNILTEQQFEDMLKTKNVVEITKILEKKDKSQLANIEHRLHSIGIQMQSPCIFNLSSLPLTLEEAKLALRIGSEYEISDKINTLSEDDKEALLTYMTECGCNTGGLFRMYFQAVDDAILNNDINALIALYPRKPSMRSYWAAFKRGYTDITTWLLQKYDHMVIDVYLILSPCLRSVVPLLGAPTQVVDRVLNMDNAMILRFMFEMPDMLDILLVEAATLPDECKTLAKADNFTTLAHHYAAHGQLCTLILMQKKLDFDITPDMLQTAVDHDQWHVVTHFGGSSCELTPSSVTAVLMRHTVEPFPDDVFKRLIGKYHEDEYAIVENPAHVVIPNNQSADAAAAQGNIEALKILYQQGHPVSHEGIKAATLAGHTDVLIWLCENACSSN